MHNERSLTPLTVHGSGAAANCPNLLLHLGRWSYRPETPAGRPSPHIASLVTSVRCGSLIPQSRSQVGIAV